MGSGGEGKRVMGIEEGMCWVEYWVSYGNQFDNKLKKEKAICYKECEDLLSMDTDNQEKNRMNIIKSK